MRLLVFEFITGGGLQDEPLPESLRREGEMMRDSLLMDLAECAELDVSVMRDPRCAVFAGHAAAKWYTPLGGENTMAFYSRMLRDVDLVWPIAPETNGALTQLAAIARSAGKHVLLSDSAALAICSSKYATYRALRACGINAVETFRDDDVLPSEDGLWIVKPDDGAGALGIGLLTNDPTRMAGTARSSIHAALQALSAKGRKPHVVQPWCQGEALSISLLCAERGSKLLSVNRQQVSIENGKVSVTALHVNALPNDAEKFIVLGESIAAALPGLWGYIGVDLICTNSNELRVLEINPRLTTSYCALREALGINLAKVVLRLFIERKLPSVVCKRNTMVELDIGIAHV